MSKKETINSPNGDIYEGEVKDGLMHGQGTLICNLVDEVSKYVGEFDDGIKEGFGTLTYPNEDEYEGGHVKDAKWIPVDEIVQRVDELPKSGNLLFICAVGARSGLAAEYASSLGIESERLFNIEDGTPTWINKGLPSSIGKNK